MLEPGSERASQPVLFEDCELRTDALSAEEGTPESDEWRILARMSKKGMIYTRGRV